jgi:hypothetical protein
MQITRIKTGVGCPHGIGHSDSWKYFSTDSCTSGAFHRGKHVYYRLSSNYMDKSVEERKLLNLEEKKNIKKLKHLVKAVKLVNIDRRR